LRRRNEVKAVKGKERENDKTCIEDKDDRQWWRQRMMECANKRFEKDDFNQNRLEEFSDCVKIKLLNCRKDTSSVNFARITRIFSDLFVIIAHETFCN
jgi:hypothetical protein